WAEEYDRDLNDVFAIEAELAQSIANRLRAKVSAAEKMAIEARPTKDLVAYNLYAHAASLIDSWPHSAEGKQPPLSQAVELLNQAIARDPAFRLKPDSSEAHLALALHFYWGYRDYDRADDKLAIAGRTLPNDARIFQLNGLIDRRHGRWHDAVRNLEHASELDPRNATYLGTLAMTYILMREYKQARETYDRLIRSEEH